MSRFSEAIESDRFLVTAELNPPKGVDVQQVLDRAASFGHLVDAFNLTDSNASIMSTGPLSLAHLLLDQDIDPILQLTCRDRNRIAIQSDLLSAYVLGVENLLCLTGDPPSNGDHPDAKPVFDLEGVGLVRVAHGLTQGSDMSGNELKGAPRFCIGAALNPGAQDLEKEILRMEQKVEAGASFFQSQAVFEPEVFAEMAARTSHVKAPVLAGIILLKSARMGRYMNEHVPGVHVPDQLLQEMDEATDKPAASIRIAARIIRGVRDAARGVHIVAIGWERHIPRLIEEAELEPPT